MPHPLTRPRGRAETAPAGVITAPARPLPGGTPDGPVAALEEHMAAARQHLDQIARQLRARAGPGVLETATITIPASGVYAQDRYRIPYASVAVLNTGAAGLTVTSSPAQDAAPGGGQGTVKIPAGAFLAINLAGSALSIYGAAGTVVTYSVMTDRIQPSASIP